MILRISSDACEKLWAFDTKSLFWTGRKGFFSMKQILFSSFIFFLVSFSSFIPNTILTDSLLFDVSRKCLTAQGSKILMPAEHTQLF